MFTFLSFLVIALAVFYFLKTAEVDKGREIAEKKYAQTKVEKFVSVIKYSPLHQRVCSPPVFGVENTAFTPIYRGEDVFIKRWRILCNSNDFANSHQAECLRDKLYPVSWANLCAHFQDNLPEIQLSQ